MAAALAPSVQPGRNTLLEPKTITRLELPGEALTDYRLIVLCNVARLDDAERAGWLLLEEYVRAGGSLLVFTGDAVEHHHYNRLGYAGGKGLLPARLAAPLGDKTDRDGGQRIERNLPISVIQPGETVSVPLPGVQAW